MNDAQSDDPVKSDRLDLDAIKSRLVAAGYPHPAGGQESKSIRAVSQEAQVARAQLREHIIADVWALLDEVESLRG